MNLLLNVSQAGGGLASFMHDFETIFSQVINLLTHVLELMGVVVLILGACKAFYSYFRKTPDMHMRLALAQSLALALEFKLGGEILRTVVARDWNEILTVGAIIVLRGVLNFMIHWEIGNIKHDGEVLQTQAGPDMPHPVKPRQP